MPESLAQFNAALQTALSQASLVKLTLSRPHSRANDVPRTQAVRAVQLRNELRWQWELQFEKQQTHLNLTAAESLARVEQQLGAIYREAFLRTSSGEITLRETREGWQVRQRTKVASPVLPQAHNREKEYLIPAGRPCAFLAQLGVMTASGEVKRDSQKKFRQINRYLEMVDDVLPSLPAAGLLRVVDFGCGLSYLTFAVHHLLTEVLQREVSLLGIDNNPAVISRCLLIAKELDLRGIDFQAAGIAQATLPDEIDLAISLHACDTATDDALATAVQRKSHVILAAPCCQHELARAINIPPLETLLQHGILKERIAALATDGLRAAALEAVGYRTQLLEFIDLEHTPKNLLLRATRRTGDDFSSAQQRYDDLKTQLGVTTLATDRIVAAAGFTPRTAPTSG